MPCLPGQRIKGKNQNPIIKKKIRQTQEGEPFCVCHKMKGKRMKMSNMIVFLVLFFCISLFGQNSGSELSEIDIQQIEAEILKINDEVIEAAELADVEAMFSVIAEDGTIIRNGDLMLSKSEAFTFYQQAYQRVQKVEYRFNEQKVQVLSKKSALMIASGESIVTTTDNRIFRTSFAQTIILQKVGCTWKVLHTHVSTLQP